MARVSNLTDETLRDYLEKGFSQVQIANLCKVSHQAISLRVKQLEKKAARLAPQHTIKAVASMWDTRAAAEENYHRSLRLLDEAENIGDKTRIMAEVRQHIEFGMKVMETLYSVQETQAFMAEVLKILDEFEPGSRARVIARLRDRRAIRAAFMPS